MCAHNNLLTELGYPQSNGKSHRLIEHIDIHIHHLRDLIEKQFVDLVYISTKIQLADVFTKALPHQTFAIHLDTLFGILPTAHLKEYDNLDSRSLCMRTTQQTCTKNTLIS